MERSDEELEQLVKSAVVSLNKEGEDPSFYRDGLLNVAAQYLNTKKEREVFRKANGYNLLTRNPGISAILAKKIEQMHRDEMEVLKAVYTLCCAAAIDYKDNAVRSLQIRGVVDNVFLMISTEKEVPKDVKMEGLRFMNQVTSDPNVCKLMCNKYDFSETELFVSDYGDTQHEIPASLFRLCRINDDPEVQEACFKLLENLACCPRLHRRICDCQKESNLEKLAESVEQSVQHGSEQPESFGAFGQALLRLCQHNKLRRLLASRPTFPEKLCSAVESLMDERTPQGGAALSSLLRVVTTVCFDFPTGDSQPEECQTLLELANQIEGSGRAARVRRWARTLRTSLELRNAVGCERFNVSRRMFYEHYDALVNESDDYTEPNRSVGFIDLLEKLRGAEWTDVPLILYAGALQVLADGIDTDENRTRFKAENGFDLLTRHRVLPVAMQKNLQDMKDEIFVMMGVYKLGIAICQDNRENTVRYIQMPNVLEHAIELMTQPPNFHPEMLPSALEVLRVVSQNPDVCKLICNKHDFVPIIHHLFNMETDVSDTVRDLRQQVLNNLVQCPKLIWRLANEDTFDKFMDCLEAAISSGWDNSVVFCGLLNAAIKLTRNSRLSSREFHRQSMMNAVSESLGIMVSYGADCLDQDAAIALVNFAGSLLRLQKNESLLNTLTELQGNDTLPNIVQAKAKEVVTQMA